MLSGSSMSEGALPDRELRAAVREGGIPAPMAIEDRQFQPASLDLRLGPEAYQLRASFLPFQETVQSRLGDRRLTESDLVIDQLTLTGSGATLQRGSVYLVPLLESLDLPAHLRGRSNPKSTTGRLDIFTRVITDATPRFDEIRSGYRGALYLEVSPQSFPVRIRIHRPSTWAAQGSTTRQSSGSRSSAPRATPTSWKLTGSTSSCPRSASGFRPSSQRRWWCTTPAPARSGHITPASSILDSAGGTGPFWGPRWLWR